MWRKITDVELDNGARRKQLKMSQQQLGKARSALRFSKSRNMGTARTASARRDYDGIAAQLGAPESYFFEGVPSTLNRPVKINGGPVLEPIADVIAWTANYWKHSTPSPTSPWGDHSSIWPKRSRRYRGRAAAARARASGRP
jgi:hypothetical protein